MGAVISPDDAFRKEKLIAATKDLNPFLRESVLKILSEWEGASSKRKLVEALGEERAKRLLEEADIR